MVNVQTLAKELLIVVIMLFVRQPTIDPSVFARLAMKDLPLDMGASRLDAELTLIVLPTNGATKANVKIPVPILEPVERTPNAVSCTIKHCVLVLLDSLATQEPNACPMSTNVPPILVDLTPDVLTWSAPLTANVNLDAPVIQGLDAIVLQLWSMAVISRSVDPTLSANQRMESVNATVHPNILMEIPTRAVHQHPEKHNAVLTLNVPSTNLAFVANVKILVLCVEHVAPMPSVKSSTIVLGVPVLNVTLAALLSVAN